MCQKLSLGYDIIALYCLRLALRVQHALKNSQRTLFSTGPLDNLVLQVHWGTRNHPWPSAFYNHPAQSGFPSSLHPQQWENITSSFPRWPGGEYRSQEWELKGITLDVRELRRTSFIKKHEINMAENYTLKRAESLLTTPPWIHLDRLYTVYDCCFV